MGSKDGVAAELHRRTREASSEDVVSPPSRPNMNVTWQSSPHAGQHAARAQPAKVLSTLLTALTLAETRLSRPPPVRDPAENHTVAKAHDGKEACPMSGHIRTQLLPITVAALLLASACGSSGGVSPGPGNGGGSTATVRVVDNGGAPVPAAGFAWQDGNGPWQAGHQGQSTYSFPVSGARYGFTVRCPDGNVWTFQLATSEGTSWTVNCGVNPDSLTANYQVQYDISQVGGTWVTVCDPTGCDWTQQSTGTFRRTTRPGRQDVVVQASNSSPDLVAVKVLPDQNIQNGSTLQATLTDADRVTPGGGTLQYSGNVSGLGIGFYYVSRMGTRARLDWSSSSPGTIRFTTLPDLVGGRYSVILESCCQDPSSGEFGGQIYFKVDTATSYNFQLPPWFSGLGFSPTPRPNFTGLSYQGFPNLPVKVYAMGLQLTATPYPGTYWTATVTTGWLGSQTSYTFPDLSGLPGFAGLPNPTGRWAVYALALRLDTSQSQSLRWVRPLLRSLADRRTVRGQQVRAQQAPPVPEIVEGGGAFRLSEGS